MHILRARAARNTANVVGVFGDRLAQPPGRLLQSIIANAHVRNMQYLRVLRPGGWRPRTRLEGEDHLRRAMADGRGAIIWNAPMAFGDLGTKLVLSNAGMPAVHLSHIFHNMSGTRFGIRFLNPPMVASENRFLAGRLVMRPDDKFDALRELRRVVTDGRLVSISAFGGGGKRTYTVPFLDGSLTFPGGAPQLARRTGAALLPAFTVREADGTLVTHIEAPLPVDDRSRSDSLESAVAAFAALLGRYVAATPEQSMRMIYGRSRR
jgi:lauroyl/myristoyl acyltransferase